MLRKVRLLAFMMVFINCRCHQIIDDDTTEPISTVLESFLNDYAGLAALEDKVHSLKYRATSYSGTDVVEQVADRLKERISKINEGMHKTRDRILRAADQSSSANMLSNSCCGYYSEETYHDGDGFRPNIYLERPCSLENVSSSNQLWNLPREIERVMNMNFLEMPHLKKQHFITEEGVFSVFPPKADLSCDTNSRPFHLRSWYAQLAKMRKIHIVVLLDTSFSMSKTHDSKPLLRTAVDAVGYLLDTLPPNTEVEIVAFNDSATLSGDCKSDAKTPVLHKTMFLKRFLSRLTAGGQSYYVDGFTAAFEVLARQMENIGDRHMAILLISDGRSSETYNNRTNEIYEAVREGNRKLQNAVRIFTYGVGRTGVNMHLLNALAQQHFDDKNTEFPRVLAGMTFRVDVPDKLGYFLQRFYSKFHENEFTTPPISRPLFYRRKSDFIMTSMIHLHHNSEDFHQMYAADFSVKELSEKELYLDSFRRSYLFIINKEGRLLLHPMISHVENMTKESTLLNVKLFEPLLNVTNITTTTYGKSGRISSQKGQEWTRWPSSYDQHNVAYTYYWRSIKDTDLIVCLVKEDDDDSVAILPEYAIPECFSDGKAFVSAGPGPGAVTPSFRYHSVNSDDESACDYFDKLSTISSSVVKFSPRSFKCPDCYLKDPDNVIQTKAFEKYFADLLNATSVSAAREILLRDGCTKTFLDLFHNNVISDALWTAAADTAWLKYPNTRFVRRFIATQSGLIRFYPGTLLPARYDPRERDWYRAATKHIGNIMISMPYEDFSSAGRIITLSRAIALPRFATNTSGKPMAVVGLDIQPFSLELAILTKYPECGDRWICVIANQEGYVVHQINGTTATYPSDHIISHNGDLAQFLLDQGLMIKVRCLDVVTRRYRKSYKIQRTTNLNSMSSRNICGRYIIRHISSTNSFFLARENHKSCYYKTCLISGERCMPHRGCGHGDSWPNAICECPCVTNVDKDPCLTSGQIRLNSDVICDPETTNDVVSDDHCRNNAVKPCFDADNCRNTSCPEKCAERKDCVWCLNHSAEGTCENIETCYKIRHAHEIDERRISPCPSEGLYLGDSNASVIGIGTSLGVIIVLIFVSAIACCSRFLRRKETYRIPLATEELDREGGDITAVAWNEIQTEESRATSLRQDQNDSKQLQHKKARRTKKAQHLQEPSQKAARDDRSSNVAPPTANSGKVHQITKARKRNRNPDTRKPYKMTQRHESIVGTRDTDTGSKSPSAASKRSGRQSPITGYDVTYKKERRHAEESNAVAKLFRSLLKGKTDLKRSNDLYMDNLPSGLDRDASYLKMFAEPSNNEGDIPIIQSDHSDNESLKNVSMMGNVDSRQQNT